MTDELIQVNGGGRAHRSSWIDQGAVIGESSTVWHFSHVYSDSRIGSNCSLGQNVMVGPGVTVGDNCKIQNNVSLYKGVVLEDGVFCGPSCVFTNVINPRASVERKNEFKETLVRKGVTIGANATIICGVELGAWSFIGAGSVVTSDVVPHALMVGVPARQIGWMSEVGVRLDEDFVCPESKVRYELSDDGNLKKTEA